MLVMGRLVVPAQAPPPSASADLVEDARRLAAAQTNEARFEALTAMLRERNRTIHTPEDGPAKLDAETMAGMLRLATSLVRRVAAGEQTLSR